MSNATPPVPGSGRPAGEPLALTVNPRLDAALGQGWEALVAAARGAGAPAFAGWLAQRLGDPALRGELRPAAEGLLGADEPEERAMAGAELAELAGEADDLLADTLWEGVWAAGLEADDADILAEAAARLAAIAEAHGDPLAAAEYHIAFLTWRRQGEHPSDPEAVELAFEEIVRLAERDGEQKAAAVWAFRQTGFTRLVEAEDERAAAGDWERDGAPYGSWA